MFHSALLVLSTLPQNSPNFCELHSIYVCREIFVRKKATKKMNLFFSRLVVQIGSLRSRCVASPLGGLSCIYMYFFPVVGVPELCSHQECLVEDMEDMAVDPSSAWFSHFDLQASMLCSVPRMARLFFSFLHTLTHFGL